MFRGKVGGHCVWYSFRVIIFMELGFEKQSQEVGEKTQRIGGGAIFMRPGDLPSRHQGLASLPTFSVISASLLSIPS